MLAGLSNFNSKMPRVGGQKTQVGEQRTEVRGRRTEIKIRFAAIHRKRLMIDRV